MPRYLSLMFFLILLLSGVGSAESLQFDIHTTGDKFDDILATTLHLPAALTGTKHINQRWLNHFQQQLPDRVTKILQPYGYFHPHTTSTVEKLNADKYRLRVDVSPGEPLRVTRIDLQITGAGASDPQLQSFRDNFPLKIDDILRQDYYEQGKAALKQKAITLGYLAADFTQHQIRIHQQEKSVEIILHLHSGELHHFGVTTFSSDENYPQSYLRRYLTYRSGATFSHQLLGTSRLKLLDSDLFSDVTIRPQFLSDVTLVPVAVDIVPLPRYRLRPGIGFGTDTGARISLDYRILNLFEKAHQFHGKLLLAQREQALDTIYIIPDLRRKDSQVTLQLGLNREETESFLNRKIFAEMKYQRSFNSISSGSFFTRLTQESSLLGANTLNTRLLLSGIRYSRQAFDDLLQPRHGTMIRLQLQGTEERFLSATSLLQFSGKVTHLLPLSQTISLLTRLEVGTTWKKDQLSDIPASLRFFAGGDNSVRGYGYNALGPKNSAGDVIGGQHLLVANLQLEKQINSKWGVALFYDIGNAFNDLDNYDLAQGTGIGVRYYSKVGTIAVDLARQIGSTGKRYRLHFGVGIGW